MWYTRLQLCKCTSATACGPYLDLAGKCIITGVDSNCKTPLAFGICRIFTVGFYYADPSNMPMIAECCPIASQAHHVLSAPLGSISTASTALPAHSPTAWPAQHRHYAICATTYISGTPPPRLATPASRAVESALDPQISMTVSRDI